MGFNSAFKGLIIVLRNWCQHQQSNYQLRLQ